MRKIILSISLVFMSISILFGQFDFKNLYLGATSGLLIPTGNFKLMAERGRNEYNIDFGYRFRDNLATGIELSRSTSFSPIAPHFKIKSCTIKTRYKISNTYIFPFIGAALGVSRVIEPDQFIYNGTFSERVEGSRNTGFAAIGEVGIQMREFALVYRYNYSGSTPKDLISTSLIKSQASI